MSKTIAVYGSLKQYKYNHPMLGNATFLGRAVKKGIMYLISTYPAFVPKNDGNEYGFELYQVEDEVYEDIRAMELGAGYDEEVRQFELDNGKVVDAIFYPASNELAEYCEKNTKVISYY